MVIVFWRSLSFTPASAIKRTVKNLPGNLKDDLDERYQEVIKTTKNCLKKREIAPLLSHIHKGSIRQIKRVYLLDKRHIFVVSVGIWFVSFFKIHTICRIGSIKY